ncbi:MAG: DegT/DnrJ/EryC1/StrS aminotransferase family protein [Actinomycetia bacterium]|nr:DegT/DnrJ/EryC1/StrS aminotransferase family protein [Actinomycetes bacterium]
MSDGVLALDGGTPVRSTPLPPWPYFAPDEVAAVVEVLHSGRVNYWTGDAGRRFETAFAEYLGAPYAIALANGTVALEAALLALNLRPGDEVIVPSRTFVATANAVALHGGRPVFADVDRDSQNVTPATISAALSPRTKGVIVVHLGGWPCEMDPIMTLARENDLFVIEDCAQALGAKYKHRPVGTIGDIGTFSFCQDKIMTTGGEGGMLVTSSEALRDRAWAMRDHGKSFAKVHNATPHDGTSFRWLHDTIGSNWRMTEMQAAIGLTALPKVHGWISRRSENARMLTACLSAFTSIRVPVSPAHVQHAHYRQYGFVAQQGLSNGWDRDRIARAIVAEGIPCGVGSCSEIYLEESFKSEGLRPATRASVARDLGDTSLAWLVHPTLEENDMRDVCEAITRVLTEATL